ncbi:MAG: tRNA pseudouridine(38-40) synthase TruA [Lachnospiraceae bacterium]|nr:tRNA pseudouridine(38-40) synthase TruA [Lachnospiraceae bacterium]
MKRNYRFTISYDGSRYFGWEHQPNTDMTIQGKIETVLKRMTDTDVEVLGAGRTDAGVHAKAMIANCFLDTTMSEQEIKNYVNQYLPDDIAITDVSIAGDRFHSRYNALGKTYRYTCYIGDSKPVFDRKYVYVLDEKPNIDRMKSAASYLIGEHDFAAFCSNPKMKKSTVRNLDSIEITTNGDYIMLTYHGSGFLQHMVRILTGTILEAGFGKRTPESILTLLEEKDRTKAGPTAPACGLCLIEVDYH